MIEAYDRAREELYRALQQEADRAYAEIGRA
jgi:hypothetical protein